MIKYFQEQEGLLLKGHTWWPNKDNTQRHHKNTHQANIKQLLYSTRRQQNAYVEVTLMVCFSNEEFNCFKTEKPHVVISFVPNRPYKYDVNNDMNVTNEGFRVTVKYI